MLLCGVCMGVLYELLYLPRRLTGFNKVATVVLDLVFCAACAALFIWFSVQASYASLRAFSFACAALGLLSARICLHGALAKLCDLLYNKFKTKPPADTD